MIESPIKPGSLVLVILPTYKKRIKFRLLRLLGLVPYTQAINCAIIIRFDADFVQDSDYTI